MTLTDAQVAEEMRMIEMEPGWPRWPVLPVKNIRRGEKDYPDDQEVGILIAGNLTTVYFKNLWDLQNGALGPQLEGVPTATYESVEALVRDGWIGD